MKCFFCGKNIRDHGPNRKKVGGQWAHKVCPGTKPYKKKRTINELTDEGGAK